MTNTMQLLGSLGAAVRPSKKAITADYLWMKLPGDAPVEPAEGFSYRNIQAYAAQVGAKISFDAYSGYTITMENGETQSAYRLDQVIMILRAHNSAHPNVTRAEGVLRFQRTGYDAGGSVTAVQPSPDPLCWNTCGAAS